MPKREVVITNFGNDQYGVQYRERQPWYDWWGWSSWREVLFSAKDYMHKELRGTHEEAENIAQQVMDCGAAEYGMYWVPVESFISE